MNDFVLDDFEALHFVLDDFEALQAAAETLPDWVEIRQVLAWRSNGGGAAFETPVLITIASTNKERRRIGKVTDAAKRHFSAFGDCPVSIVYSLQDAGWTLDREMSTDGPAEWRTRGGKA